MPIILGGLTVGFLALITALALLGMHRTAGTLVRSLLDGFSEQKGFKKWFFRAVGLVALGHAISWVVRRVRQVISNAAAANLGVVSLYLRDLGALAHFTYKELSALAPSWADSFGIFRHATLPREINRKVLPVKATATHAGAVAGRANARVAAEERARRRSISLTNTRLGAIAAGLLGIDVLVRGRHAAEHHRVHTRDIPQIRDRDIPHGKAVEHAHGSQLARHAARIKAIEKALGLGVFGVLIYRILARVAPWLFCRNWKVLGRAVCGLNPAKLTSLLGLLTAVLVLRDLLSLTRHAEGIVGGFTHGITKTLTGIDLPGERFTID